MGYKEDISINKNHLWTECARQPMLIFGYIKEKEELQIVRRRLEIKLDIAEALADEYARTSLGDKTKEAAVKKLISRDEEVIRLQEELLEAEKDVHTMEGAVKALSDKTKMLSDLVKMQLAHWQAEPQVPNEWNRRQEEGSSKAQLSGLGDALPKKSTKLEKV